MTIQENGSSLLAPLFAAWATGFHTPALLDHDQHRRRRLGYRYRRRHQRHDRHRGLRRLPALERDDQRSRTSRSPSPPSRSTTTSQAVNTTHLKLNAKVLDDIYAGTITKWNDPAISGAQPGRDAASSGHHAAPPLGLERGHIPLHVVPERRRPVRLGRQAGPEHLGDLPERRRCPGRSEELGDARRLPDRSGLHRLHRHQLPAEDAGGRARRGDARRTSRATTSCRRRPTINAEATQFHQRAGERGHVAHLRAGADAATRSSTSSTPS